jgi:PPK2 family polyphosphate:nucleotide phosphotransferase
MVRDVAQTLQCCRIGSFEKERSVPHRRRDFSKRFLVRPGHRVSLEDLDSGETNGWARGDELEAALRRSLSQIDELQYLLYAEKQRALLIVLQAMDAGGKDGLIRHVMSGFNPQGCSVTSFKVPTQEEAQHDFLWRIHRRVPGLGEVGIFNRSHYEDVLVARVRGLVPRGVWSRRYDMINAFERHLTDNGVVMLKFFLHISRKEQKKRLQARLDDPARQWKFSPADLQERKRWSAYVKAYEGVLERCSTPHAPWYVIPSDRKWFRNLAVADIIVENLESLKMTFPRPTFDPSTIRIR